MHKERRHVSLGDTSSPDPAGGRPTILVIDDEQDLLLMLQEILEDAGYMVLLAGNGQEGFDRALDGHPDLILTDLMMPGMDGHTLCRHLRAEPRTARIPLIAISAAYRSQDGDAFDAVLVKPFGIEPLLEMIRAQLGGEP